MFITSMLILNITRSTEKWSWQGLFALCCIPWRQSWCVLHPCKFNLMDTIGHNMTHHHILILIQDRTIKDQYNPTFRFLIDLFYWFSFNWKKFIFASAATTDTPKKATRSIQGSAPAHWKSVLSQMLLLHPGDCRLLWTFLPENPNNNKLNHYPFTTVDKR